LRIRGGVVGHLLKRQHYIAPRPQQETEMIVYTI
jgi:hypothetical protein